MNKEQIIEAFKETLPLLGLYDYLAYAALFLIFIIFVFLSAAIKNGALGFLLVFFGLILILSSPIAVPAVMNETIKTTELNITISKKLQFTDTVLITGIIKNRSELDLKQCRVYARVCKKGANPIKQFANCLKPLAKGEFTIKEPLRIGDENGFRFAFDEFTYQKEFTTSLYARCH